MIKSDLVSKIDEYGEIHLSEDEIIDAILMGNEISNVHLSDDSALTKYEGSVKRIAVDHELKFYPSNNYSESPKHVLRRRSTKWTIPPEYMYMDIVGFLLEKCKSPVEVSRVEAELQEFIKRGELNILIVMKYIVDTFRNHGVVWGVGRGSSVSLYCLYLIGINKINPLKYDIAYTDYFKEIDDGE